MVFLIFSNYNSQILLIKFCFAVFYFVLICFSIFFFLTHIKNLEKVDIPVSPVKYKD